MPRIRSIKPDFFKSEDVSTLPLRARLTWVGLWTQCDDHGRYKDSARLIKGDIWSLDDVSLRDIEADLTVLAAENRIVRYEVDGKRYLAIVNWHAHQAINRPGKPKHPGPPMALGSTDADSPRHCSTGPCNSGNPHASLTASTVSPTPVDGGTSAGRGAESNGGSQFRESSVSTHGGLTPGKEGRGREGRGSAREGSTDDPGQPRPASGPPPSKCEKHTNDPNPPACGACGDARRTRQEWDAARRRAEREAPKCRSHRGQPADNCALCRSEALAGPDQEAT